MPLQSRQTRARRAGRTRINLALLTPLALVALTACGGDSDSSGGGDNSAGGGGGGNQSDEPNPSAAVADQDSFSIAADKLTVDRAADEVNIENEITVKLADNLNNTVVPDGTRVTFTAEGGTIPPFCETVDGRCTVMWSSGEPEPADNRVTILAWTRGSESYLDLNSNGFFDDGDLQTDDLPEAFRDDNESGVRDTDELFVEFPSGITVASGSNSSHDAADGLYSGPDCAHASDCASSQSLFIFRNMTIVLGTAGIGSVTFTDCAGGPATAPLGPGTHCALVTDAAGNPMPDGSDISLDADAIGVNGPSSTLATTSPNGSRIVFELAADDTPDTGTLQLAVESSGGAWASGQISTSD